MKLMTVGMQFLKSCKRRNLVSIQYMAKLDSFNSVCVNLLHN